MSSYDVVKLVKHLQEKALPPYGAGLCATHIRQALEAAGLDTTGRPGSAKDYGPLLVRLGFFAIAESLYSAVKGDIAVIQGTSKSAHGHVQVFDGHQWISDFKQPDFWPGPSYRNEKPSHLVYRHDTPSATHQQFKNASTAA
jgi:hypothetical protein